MKIIGKVAPDGTIVRMEKAAKSGEGSRGGHVIGHTKSGKPIYGDAFGTDKQFAEHHKGWSAMDHYDAEHAHRSKAHHGDSAFHEHMGNAHRAMRRAAQARANVADGAPWAADDVAAHHHEALRAVDLASRHRPAARMSKPEAIAHHVTEGRAHTLPGHVMSGDERITDHLSVPGHKDIKMSVYKDAETSKRHVVVEHGGRLYKHAKAHETSKEADRTLHLLSSKIKGSIE